MLRMDREKKQWQVVISMVMVTSHCDVEGGFSFTIWKNRRRQAGAEWRFGWHCRDQILLSVYNLYIASQSKVRCIAVWQYIALSRSNITLCVQSVHCISEALPFNHVFWRQNRSHQNQQKWKSKLPKNISNKRANHWLRCLLSNSVLKCTNKI